MNTAKMKLLVGGVLIAGGLGYLGYLAADANAAYAVDVKHYLDDRGAFGSRGLRLAGRTAGESWKQEGSVNTFLVHDLKDCGSVVPVRYDGTLPDTFREGANVIVEGKYATDGVFHATLVMAQCPSKYDAAKLTEVSCKRDGAGTTLVQVASQ